MAGEGRGVNYEQWKVARQKGIGASDAACILGLNPWKSNVQLWEEKTGLVIPEDIGDKPAVVYGKTAEAPLRELFALDFPQYAVAYDEFGMISQPIRPWLFATLDASLTEVATGRKGILEVKTTEIQRSAQWVKWDNRVPDHYFIQVLHQLLATGYDFVWLKVQIKWHKAGEMQITVRHYYWERAELLEDMQYLLKAEEGYWDCVINKHRPDLILPEI